MRAVPGTDERGAAAVLGVAMMGLLVTVTLGVSGAVGVVGAHRRAQSAADLAALAGAGALQDGGDACARAAVIAGRNGASLRRCEVDDWDVQVEVARRVRLLGHDLELPARGRAGPVRGGA